MKLSIITINLNNCEGLKKTLYSVISQTYKDFEWIVIDGGSTDGSRELIEEYSSYMSYWVSEPDKGIYNAMNKGVSHAKGDYCQFLNSGDWLYASDTLEKVFSDNHDEDVLYGDYVQYFDDSNLKRIVSVKDVTFFTLNNYSLCHNVCFIKRQDMLDLPYDENLKIMADWKFFLQSVLSGKSFRHVDVNVLYFNMQGVSNTNFKLFQEERTRVLEQLCPPFLRLDMKRVSAINKAEEYLANTPLDVYVRLRQRHPLLGKGITFVVLLMKRLK